MEEGQIHAQRLSSTQIGAVGEAVVAAGLMIASSGRLSPFKPIADDDGLDLLLFDKSSRRAHPLQIKCRAKYDDVRAQTVQFDVRLKTFAAEGHGFVLCAVLDGVDITACWLFHAQELKQVARPSAEKLTVVCSAKPESNDKFRPFRHAGLDTIVQRILL